jgi:hypothetical protein
MATRGIGVIVAAARGRGAQAAKWDSMAKDSSMASREERLADWRNKLAESLPELPRQWSARLDTAGPQSGRSAGEREFNKERRFC